MYQLMTISTKLNTIFFDVFTIFTKRYNVVGVGGSVITFNTGRPSKFVSYYFTSTPSIVSFPLKTNAF